MEIDYKYLHDALDRLEHTSTVAAFQYQFQAIQNLLVFLHPEIPDSYFASRFISGLQVDFQNFLIKFKPVTVLAAFKLALIYEESIYLDYFPEPDEILEETHIIDDTLELTSVGEVLTKEARISEPLMQIEEDAVSIVHSEVMSSSVSEQKGNSSFGWQPDILSLSYNPISTTDSSKQRSVSPSAIFRSNGNGKVFAYVCLPLLVLGKHIHIFLLFYDDDRLTFIVEIVFVYPMFIYIQATTYAIDPGDGCPYTFDSRNASTSGELNASSIFNTEQLFSLQGEKLIRLIELLHQTLRRHGVVPSDVFKFDIPSSEFTRSCSTFSVGQLEVFIESQDKVCLETELCFHSVIQGNHHHMPLICWFLYGFNVTCIDSVESISCVSLPATPDRYQIPAVSDSIIMKLMGWLEFKFKNYTARIGHLICVEIVVEAIAGLPTQFLQIYQLVQDDNKSHISAFLYISSYLLYGFVFEPGGQSGDAYFLWFDIVVMTLLGDSMVMCNNQATHAPAVQNTDLVATRSYQVILPNLFNESAVVSDYQDTQDVRVSPDAIVTSWTSTMIMDPVVIEDFVDQVEVLIAWDLCGANISENMILDSKLARPPVEFSAAVNDNATLQKDSDIVVCSISELILVCTPVNAVLNREDSPCKGFPLVHRHCKNKHRLSSVGLFEILNGRVTSFLRNGAVISTARPFQVEADVGEPFTDSVEESSTEKECLDLQIDNARYSLIYPWSVDVVRRLKYLTRSSIVFTMSNDTHISVSEVFDFSWESGPALVLASAVLVTVKFICSSGISPYRVVTSSARTLRDARASVDRNARGVERYFRCLPHMSKPIRVTVDDILPDRGYHDKFCQDGSTPNHLLESSTRKSLASMIVFATDSRNDLDTNWVYDFSEQFSYCVIYVWSFDPGITRRFFGVHEIFCLMEFYDGIPTPHLSMLDPNFSTAYVYAFHNNTIQNAGGSNVFPMVKSAYVDSIQIHTLITGPFDPGIAPCLLKNAECRALGRVLRKKRSWFGNMFRCFTRQCVIGLTVNFTLCIDPGIVHQNVSIFPPENGAFPVQHQPSITSSDIRMYKELASMTTKRNSFNKLIGSPSITEFYFLNGLPSWNDIAQEKQNKEVLLPSCFYKIVWNSSVFSGQKNLVECVPPASIACQLVCCCSGLPVSDGSLVNALWHITWMFLTLTWNRTKAHHSWCVMLLLFRKMWCSSVCMGYYKDLYLLPGFSLETLFSINFGVTLRRQSFPYKSSMISDYLLVCYCAWVPTDGGTLVQSLWCIAWTFRSSVFSHMCSLM